jgi:thiamine-phosphate pyrophosphorylase
VLLCYVTNRRGFAATECVETQRAFLLKIEAAAAAGVDWIQIREKDLSGRDCALLTREALQRAAKLQAGKTARTRIIVNDRLDVALTENADGAHLGEKSLPVAQARRLVVNRGERNDFVIGVSCHSLEAATGAERGGADYLFFGPVFATPSKVEFGAPQGLERLATVCREVSIPVLAIGGITLDNASACFASGASGIAAIRLFQDARDISSLMQSLRRLAL